MDLELDNAMNKKGQIRDFLVQDIHELVPFNETVAIFRKVVQ